MHLVYDEVSVPGQRASGGFDMNRYDPHNMYEKHLENMFYLRFILNHHDTGFSEKRQADKEIEVCERKLTFWTKHPRFSEEERLKIHQKVKKKWQ